MTQLLSKMRVIKLISVAACFCWNNKESNILYYSLFFTPPVASPISSSWIGGCFLLSPPFPKGGKS